MRKLLIILAATVCLLGLGGCLLLKQPPMDNSAIDAYTAHLARDAAQSDDDTTAAGIERWKALLSDFSVENINC